MRTHVPGPPPAGAPRPVADTLPCGVQPLPRTKKGPRRALKISRTQRVYLLAEEEGFEPSYVRST